MFCRRQFCPMNGELKCDDVIIGDREVGECQSAILSSSTDDADFHGANDAEGETGGDNQLSEADLEAMRRELTDEISELEWEFRQIKEALYTERIGQIEKKLVQLKSSEASELKKVTALVDKAYHTRKQVAKFRRDLELEIANKELDNALQMASYDAAETLRVAEERIRLRLQESICTLQIERALANRRRPRRNLKDKSDVGTTDHQKEPLRCVGNGALSSAQLAALVVDGGNDEYLPGQDLEARRKPVTLSPSFPRLIYEMDEEDIRSDLQAIMNAVKEQKVAAAISRLNAQKRES